VTDNDTIRAQARVRGTRHRALKKQRGRVYPVPAHERLLADALVRWGVPYQDAQCHAKATGALGEVVEIAITDPIAGARIGEVFAARRRR
jgi:hypothetical protein